MPIYDPLKGVQAFRKHLNYVQMFRIVDARKLKTWNKTQTIKAYSFNIGEVSIKDIGDIANKRAVTLYQGI